MSDDKSGEKPSLNWREIGMRWVSEQSLPTVLLLVLIGSMAWTVYHVVHDVVPEHLKQIQSGYDRMAESHEKAITKVVESHEKDRQLFMDIFNGRESKREETRK